MILLIIAGFCGVFPGGCGAYVSRFPDSELPDRSGPVLAGRMGIDAVHETLGPPLVASRFWRVELFRDASSQTEVPIVLFLPFGMIKDEIYRYTLVSYDKDHFAQATATGILRNPSGWRKTSPIGPDHLDLHLKAGDFTFVREWEDRKETLLADPVRRDLFLEHVRFSPQCTAVIGCGVRECSDRLWVDGGPMLPVPCKLKEQNTVAALGLSPGNHTIKTSGGRWQHGERAGLLSGEQSTTFSCGEGEIVYLVIDVSVRESGWRGAEGAEWNIDLEKAMPPFFANRPMVLFRDGMWLANPEPENPSDRPAKPSPSRRDFRP